MELSPETMLRDRYRIIQLLGKGGMGAVYLAYDVSLEHQVAVKINHNPSPQGTSQFMREARLLAMLRHPNLPRVIDYFVIEQNQYLVMDYIAGEDLESLLKAQGAQPVEKVLRWAEQLGSALSYLHRQNPPIIHRDIKPANLKLTPEGEVILVDFGIAKASAEGQATATGAQGYTPGYAPPEQYGSAHTSPASDQYSFAATLYNLLTGHKPVDAIERVLDQAVLSPMRLLNPGIPAHVQAAIERGLSVRPEDRFASVEEMIHALIDPSFQATVIRPPAGAAAATVYTGGGSQPPVIPPAQAAAPAASQPARSRTCLWVAIAAAAVVGVLALVAIAGGAGYFFIQGNNTKAPATITPQPATQAVAVQITSTAPQTAATLPVLETSTPQPLPTETVPPTVTSTASPEPTATLQAVAQGKRIAFVSDRGDGKIFQIWTMRVSLDNSGNVIGDDLKQVTFDPISKRQPEWSPEGNRIVYVAPGGKDAKGKDLGLDLWIINLERPDDPPVNLTHRWGDDTDPSFSPDGLWIAYTSNGREDKVRQMYFISPDGQNSQRISVDLEEYHPIWSPDMTWLGYIFYRGYNAFYLRSNTSGYSDYQSFDNTSFQGRLGEVADPAWSPDGSQIAYTRVEGLAKNIFSALFKERGGSITRLTSSNRDREPAWSADSEWIAFTSERDGNPEIYIMRSTGNLQTNLTQLGAGDMQPAWQK